MIEQVIVGATGLGYLTVGALQWTKGEGANGMIWIGYAFAQVGLWLNLKGLSSTGTTSMVFASTHLVLNLCGCRSWLSVFVVTTL